jgi:hypothetical protein
VSCSPPRLPIARLAAAQAALESSSVVRLPRKTDSGRRIAEDG